MMNSVMHSLSTMPDKWNHLKSALLFNVVISLGFFISCLFVGFKFGLFGIGFQPLTTSTIYLYYSWLIFQCARDRQDFGPRPDFIIGISILMNLLLVQTSFLWANLGPVIVAVVQSDGSGIGGSQVTCFGNGDRSLASGAEAAVSSFALILFVLHSGILFVISLWHQELGVDMGFTVALHSSQHGSGSVRPMTTGGGNAVGTGSTRDGIQGTYTLLRATGGKSGAAGGGASGESARPSTTVGAGDDEL